MSRGRMIFWAIMAFVVIWIGVSLRDHDLRVSKRNAARSTDKPEAPYDYDYKPGDTVISRAIEGR